MANGDPPVTAGRSLLNLKGGLAFFLVCVAGVMVLSWMWFPPKVADSSSLALLAGFVTLFIKMAADAVGYQYNSSSGSDKKDDTQADVAGKLADKVQLPSTSGASVPVPPWWGRLKDEEKTAITTAGEADPRVKAFVTASQVGAAGPDDLAYLVSKGLLTQARADEIKGA